MKILIVEPEIEGHHLVMYVRFLVRGLVKKKINFSILTSKKIKKHSTYEILKKEKKNIEFLYLKDLRYPKKKDPFSLYLFQISNYFKIKKSFEYYSKKKKFDHIFLTTLDHIDKVIPFFGSPFGNYKFSSIILNPKNHFGEYNNVGKYKIKKSFYDFSIKKILKIKQLKDLYSNDPLFIKYIKNRYKNLSRKIQYFNEPEELSYLKNQKIAKKELNYNSKDFIILVYGAIRNSKSVTELINYLNNNNLNPKIKVLLCGKQTEEIKKFLKKKISISLIKKNKLKIINKFLNLKEESNIFSASDLIWVVYKESALGSSGVLFLAKKAKTPIITSKLGLPYWFNKKYMLGPAVDLNDEKKIIKTLNKLSNNKLFYNKFKINIKKRSKFNFVEMFYLKILKNLNLKKTNLKLDNLKAFREI